MSSGYSSITTQTENVSMRLLSGLSWAALLLAARTIASEAYIYISDSPEVTTPQALSPEATRLLLARRLGLSRYHSLEAADETTLKALNHFGGKQRALLSTDELWRDPQRNLVVIEDVGDVSGGLTSLSTSLFLLIMSLELLNPRSPQPAFKMSNIPYSFQTVQLVDDLFEQSADTSVVGEQTRCFYNFPDQSLINGGIASGLDTNGVCYRNPAYSKNPDTNHHLDAFLKEIKHTVPSRTIIINLSMSRMASSKDPSKGTQHLRRIVSRLLHPTDGEESTVILMPPSNAKAKRTSTSPYGTYAMPNRQPLQPREGQTEAPLAASSEPQTSLASHHVSTPQVLKASSIPNPGILPVCQTNLDKLIEITNNCSGHGTPYLKRKASLEPKGKTAGDCYACKCGKTVLSRDEGKGVKTIDWAGPACSKKDVSMPFWLLAGISIAMVATVSWGVGLLFSIGQEDLPSVIGAGVAGPRAQK
ncbi:MAG: hypothetical protein Q9166_002609 [cf. Caloplaca sp. 2 TL-2023]